MSTHLVLLAASPLPGQPCTAGAMVWLLVGVAVGMAATVLVRCLCGKIGRGCCSDKPGQVQARAGAAGAGGDTDKSAVTAAIVAAVHTTLGDQCRIVSVTPVEEASRGGWAVEGRRQQFQSHKIR